MPKERKLSEDELNEIQRLAEEVFSWIPKPESPDDPEQVIEAIDEYVVKLKNIEKRKFSKDQATDIAFQLGPRWGEEMRRALGWDWINFQDDRGGEAYAVAAPDRSVICFPMETIYRKLLERAPDVTIMLIFNMIKGGSVPGKPGSYHSIG
jgi:hypothetical protein